MDGVGARHNEPYVNGAVYHAAPSVNHFKVDPPKPFEGKTLDGTALESWLYQMNLYFFTETSLLENLCVARAALLLTSNAATWFRAQGWDPTVRASPASEPCTTWLHCTGPYAVVRYTYT